MCRVLSIFEIRSLFCYSVTLVASQKLSTLQRMASWDSRPSRQCRQVLHMGTLCAEPGQLLVHLQKICVRIEWFSPLQTHGMCFMHSFVRAQGYRQDEEQQERVPKNAQGRSTPFPKRLLAMIRREAVRNPLIVRWSLDGRAFFIDDDDIFVTDILPVYGFKASKMQSFQRNLNIYGFTRLTKGPYASGYVHPQFGRDKDDDQLEYIVRDSGKANCSNGGGDECTPKAKTVKYHQESRDGSNEGPGMRLTGGENACHSREHGSRRPGPALRAYPSYSSRDMNFSTSRVESTSALTEMRLAHQLMLEKDLMSQVHVQINIITPTCYSR